MCGLGVLKCRLAGTVWWRSISTALIRPAMPAAASVWPMLVFTEPTRSGSARGRRTRARQRVHLDRVAQRGAGAVRLDVVDGGGREAGVGERRADHGLLRTDRWAR